MPTHDRSWNPEDVAQDGGPPDHEVRENTDPNNSKNKAVNIREAAMVLEPSFNFQISRPDIRDPQEAADTRPSNAN